MASSLNQPENGGGGPDVDEQIFDDPSYQRLSDVQINLSSSSHDYEDPTALLLNVPQRPSQRRAVEPPPRGPKPLRLTDEDIEEALVGSDGSSNEALPVPYSALQSQRAKMGGESGSGDPEMIEEWNSEGSSDEGSAIISNPAVIRQTFPVADESGTRRGTPTAKGEDEKLFVSGSLVEHKAPFSFKSRAQRVDSSGSLQEQGIYQGLVMTDAEKQRLGILPESMYMTTNLEQWASQLEDMSLKYPSMASSSSASSLPQQPQPPLPTSAPKRHPKVSVPAGPLIAPKYRDFILRPPPLPPVPSGATRQQRKAYAVVDSLLKSEAAFLTSLNIAIQTYMRPLHEMSSGPSPILDRQQVEVLFGPISKVISHHELFYTALTSRTMQWAPMQRIGDIFMSSFSRKEVIRNYSEYVNNFTEAMAVLERAIKKKPKFVNFLKEKYKGSKTSLSLQGLLLKPIQRFPQYILFLQDVLKYTSITHPDHLHLQMALSRFEAIADYLNETKRRKEQCCIVQHLNTRVSRLPFKLVDSKRWLYRQDVVTTLLFTKAREVIQKRRILLLFNNMVLCASVKHKPKAGDLESSTGSKDFKTNEGATYTCKWYAPLDSVKVVEPDYHRDIWDHILCGDDAEEEMATYRRLKAEHKKLEHDFTTMGRIAGLVATLHEEHEGLTLQNLQHYTRVLQRRLARNKEQIQQCQVGRLDIITPSWDGSQKVHHTYLFVSEKAKQDWLNTLRYAGLKMNRFNTKAWVFAEDLDDEDIVESVHRLPLFVDSFKLMGKDSISVECAVKVGSNEAWFASGDSTCAQVTVVNCITPSPIILESFTVDSARVMTIIYVPPAAIFLSKPGSTPPLPAHMETVWMGTQCGKLVIYNASSESSRKCISCTQFPDSITCMYYFNDQVFLATAEGNIVIFSRAVGGCWDLNRHKTVSVHGGAIRSLCAVGRHLWIGAGSSCYILNMESHKMEGNVELGSMSSGISVSKMAAGGAGVWISFNRSANLELYHAVTRLCLQQIDVGATLNRLIAKHKIDKLSNLDRLHITALMASDGYMWIGTSIGAILIYRIPQIGGVPLVEGNPYLAMDSHKEAVRVLLTVKTVATVSSSRVSQFISDEDSRETLNESYMEQLTVGGSEGTKERSPFNSRRSSASSYIAPMTSTFDPSATLRCNSPPPLPKPSFDGLSYEEGRQHIMERRTSAKATYSNLEEVGDELLPTPTSKVQVSPSPREETAEAIDGTPQEAGRMGKEEEDENGKSEEKETVQGNSEVDTGVLVSDELEPVLEAPEDAQAELNRSSDYELVDPLPTYSKAHSEMTQNGNSQEAPAIASLVPAPSSNGDLSISRLPGPYFDDQQMTTPSVNGPSASHVPNPNSDSTTLKVKTTRSVASTDPCDTTIIRVSSPDSGSSTNEYDEVETYHSFNASDYESPLTLEREGPAPVGDFFTPVTSLAPTIPGRSTEPQEGAVFILTAGRGIVDLRPGKKTGVLFPAPHSRSVVSTAGDEGCMIAYEIGL